MKKILVPTDFSPLADTALHIAVEIGRKTGGEIELLHVIEASYEKEIPAGEEEITLSGKKGDALIIKSANAARERLNSIIDNAKFAGIRFNPKIKTGNASKHLSNSITQEKIDLIVMGTEGAKGLFKGILSKTKTEEVVMHAECLVLSVKEHQKNFKLKNLVFATDFKDISPKFIEKIKALQDLFYFKLHILYVNSKLNHKKDISEVLNEKEEFVKKYKLSDYEFHAIEDFTEYTGITEYANKIDADVIALTTHQKKGFWHWVGGISEDLVNYAEKPILTYKAEN